MLTAVATASPSVSLKDVPQAVSISMGMVSKKESPTAFTTAAEAATELLVLTLLTRRAGADADWTAWDHDGRGGARRTIADVAERVRDAGESVEGGGGGGGRGDGRGERPVPVEAEAIE